MASKCYWCEDNKPKIVNSISLVNQPLGCCKKCQVLSCGHHAQRDNFIKEYLCFDCDISILVASGSQLTVDADLNQLAKDTVDKISEKKSYGIESFLIPNEELFSSYNDFKKRREGFKELFSEIERLEKTNWQDIEVRMLFERTTEDAKLLFITAAVIIDKTLINQIEERYPSFINKIVKEIKNRGGLQWKNP